MAEQSSKEEQPPARKLGLFARFRKEQADVAIAPAETQAESLFSDHRGQPAPVEEAAVGEAGLTGAEAANVPPAEPATEDSSISETAVSGSGMESVNEVTRFGKLKQVFRRSQESAIAEAAMPQTAADLPPGQSTGTGSAESGGEAAREKRFGKIREALARTGKGLGRVFLGKKQIDEELLEALETQLLSADLGIEVTSDVIGALTDKVKRKELNDVAALRSTLKGLLTEILRPCEKPLVVEGGKPFVILIVGVNGVGKTTTIGKLAKQFVSNNKSVMLAAGDTFRAAAVEQLQVWGARNKVNVVAQHTGADSASVIFDAMESAKSRHTDVLIADTAGRLHTKTNLMDELKKIKRVLAKLDSGAPHEVLLVLDAGTGQNAVTQLQQFNEAVGVTGITLTKLDGTAKGGVIFALCRRFGIPVRYIGVGETAEDLQPFRAEDFVSALLASDALE